MNADFPDMDVTQKIAEVDNKYLPLKEAFDEAFDMEGADHFYETIEMWTSAMAAFKQKCEIGFTFYK